MFKKVVIVILMFVMFCSCAIEEPVIEEPQSETETSVPESEEPEFTEEKYEAAVKELGYTEEQLSYIEGLVDEGLSPLAIMNPLKYSKYYGKTTWPEGMEYSIGSFCFDPEIYVDHGGPIGFVYVRKDGKIKIVPEWPSLFPSVKWGVVDSDTFYFGGSSEIKFYNVSDISAPAAKWSVPEEKLLNKEWSPILTSASSAKNGEVIVIWVNRPADYDTPFRGENLDETNYMLAVLDSEGNLIGDYDTKVKIKRYTYGISDVVYPEIKAVCESRVLFKVNNLHYVIDFAEEDPAAEQYVFTEKDVVKYSNIDFWSDFAKSAEIAVEEYIKENYSQSGDIAKFDIRRAEIDESATLRGINLDGGAVKELFDTDDIVNGFLVIRTITDIEYTNGTTDSKEFKYFVLFDPENKYDRGRMIADSGWKVIDGSKEMFDAPAFDDNRFYRYFEEGKIEW